MAGFGDVWEDLKGLGGFTKHCELVDGTGGFGAVCDGLEGFGRALTRFGRVSDVLGRLGWAHVERSLFHSAKQPFTSNGARVRTGSQEKL